MSELKKINNENLENIAGGNDGCPEGWVYATVQGVVHYDSSSCLTLRDCPGGNVRYTPAAHIIHKIMI